MTAAGQPPKKEQQLAAYDAMLQAQDTTSSPWTGGRYIADLDLLKRMLSIPIRDGDPQTSGRPAKAFDAWIAHELRRGGFSPDEVWPRTRSPRVLPSDAAPLERRIDRVQDELDKFEQTAGKALSPRRFRDAIRGLGRDLPGAAEPRILGDFYAKQIDVAISSWKRGPDVLVSTKTMFSSYRNNLTNRHEEAVGEVKSLRARHPMATIGFAFLFRRSIFDKPGDYGIAYDILERLRRRGEAYDATMLLVVDWDDTNSSKGVTRFEEPAKDLNASRFFADMIDGVIDRTPNTEHKQVRTRRAPEPFGGLPDEDEDLSPDDG